MQNQQPHHNTPRRQSVARPDGSDVMAAASLLAAETALLGCLIFLHLPWALWLLAHLSIVAWFAYQSWPFRPSSRDLSARFLSVLTALVGGPAGCLALVVALMLWRRQRTRPELLEAWYDRIALAGDIDDVTRLADTVAMGRAIGTSEHPPMPFNEVMESGTLAERQAALGLIARRFSPDYAPALQTALVTNEPMVRVQAAAVATRVRAELKSEVRSATADASANNGQSGDLNASQIARLRALIGTGMIEDDDREAAEAEIKRLASLSGGLPPPADLVGREHLETELLKLGNFAAFRTMRSSALPAVVADGPANEAAHGN